MPSWSEARDTRVEDHSYKSDNMEMGNLHRPGMASTAHLPPQESGVTQADSKPLSHRAPSPYTGPDFEAGVHQQHPIDQHYTGPDFSNPPSQTSYTAYAPSQSTKYEPTLAELGTTDSHTGYHGGQAAGRM